MKWGQGGKSLWLITAESDVEPIEAKMSNELSRKAANENYSTRTAN